MSKQTESNLFILPSFSRSRGFYQQLLSGLVSYEGLTTRILRQIDAAYAFRQVETVAELARILVNIPAREYQLIGQYYLVWCKSREVQYQPDVLERIIEQTRTYKAKALISRAALEVFQTRFEHALYFYSEAIKANPTISEYIVASRGIATAKSMEGFHSSALRDIERLIPLLKYAVPLTYFEVFNSYAVELTEVGRLEEACSASRLVMQAPFALAYPEWRETRNEIELRRTSRSLVAFTQTGTSTGNLLQMPLAAHPGLVEPFRARGHAPVLDMQAWKKKMTKEDEKPARPVTSEEKQARLKELRKLKPREVILEIMDKIGDEQVTDARLLQALIVLEELESLEDEE